MNFFEKYFGVSLVKGREFNLLFSPTQDLTQRLFGSCSFIIGIGICRSCHDIKELLKIQAIGGLKEIQCKIDEVIKEIQDDKPQN